MDISLTPDQEALALQGIAAGRYQSREDAVRDALARWEEDERDRAELIAALDEAEHAIDRGEHAELDDASLSALFEGVKRRGRERLAAAEQQRG